MKSISEFKKDCLKNLHLCSRPAVEWLRSVNDLGFSFRSNFLKERRTAEYQSVFDKPDPLVTVCIATYNRAELLITRALTSILDQDYKNLQVIVVGDHCTDDTEERMRAITDPRVQFVNLPVRGDYPQEPRKRWMVAGTAAVNHALSLAKGDFITHLDDDDEHPKERILKLVEFIQQERADLVWHPFHYERVPGEWHVNPGLKFQGGYISTSSVLYHHWFRRISWDINAWQYDEPGDWNRFRKFRFLGVRAMRYPEALLHHYREMNQQKS